MTDEERLTPFPQPAQMPALTRYRVWYIGVADVESFILEGPTPQYKICQTLRDNGHTLANGYWIAPSALLGVQIEDDDDGGDQ